MQLKEDFKKYRITAFALLIVVCVNIVMPAAVLATSFYCNIDSDSPSDTVGPAVDCCIENGLIGESELTGPQESINYCTFLQDCSQSISDPFTDLDSLLPTEKKVKISIASFPLFGTIQYPDSGWNIASHISLSASLPYSTPPAFLVNRTFLN